jgi:four helix bundle protein
VSKESTLNKKSFVFATRIIKLCSYVKHEFGAYELSSQLLRSGTAVGALIREAEHAESRNDFIHKLNVSLKEANETIYWIELMYSVGYLSEKMFGSIIKDATELLKMLISSIKTLKNSNIKEHRSSK